MSTAQHAERILAAWNGADPEKFENELESALHCCRKRSKIQNMIEMEQRELLESVVVGLRGSQSLKQGRPKTSAQSVSAGFALLQHLSHRAAA